MNIIVPCRHQLCAGFVIMVYIMCYVYCELHYEYVRDCYEHHNYVLCISWPFWWIFRVVVMNIIIIMNTILIMIFITIILYNHQMIMVYITCIVAIDEWLHWWYKLLGRAWASPTLAWLHCTHACVCLLACLLAYLDRPLTVNHFRLLFCPVTSYVKFKSHSIRHEPWTV